MTPNSQGDILVSTPTATPPTKKTTSPTRPPKHLVISPLSASSNKPSKHPRTIPWSSSRPLKKPRPTSANMSGVNNKENIFAASHQDRDVKSFSSKSAPVRERGIAEVKVKEEVGEQDLMKDLLSGLDASMFDNFELSPVRPTKSQPKTPSNSHPPAIFQDNEAFKVELESLEVNVPSRPATVPKSNSTKHMSHLSNPISRPPTPAPAFKPITVKRDPEPNLNFGHQNTFNSSVPSADVALDVKTNIKLDDKCKSKLTDSDILVPASMASSHFDDDFHFELDLVELGDIDYESLSRPQSDPTKTRYPILNPVVPPSPDGYSATPWIRCVIEEVHDGIQSDGSERSPGKVSLTMGGFKSSPNVHAKDHTKPIVITFKDPSSFLIHHPDQLITMTSIANAMPCPRRPLLQSLIKLPGSSTKSMIHGTILHALLQGSLLEQDFSAEKTYRRIEEEIGKEERKLELWGAGLSDEDVVEEMGKRAAKGFEIFAEKWIGEKPSGDLHTSPGENNSRLAIYGLHEVEEDIWSLKWGLKGKVDASVQSRIIIHKAHNQKGMDSEIVEENIAPLEIKTGRAVGVLAHRAQTMLYTLLMEDRYGVPVPAGLLYYSQLDSILRVEAKSNEIRALIFARNELAHWLSRKRRLNHKAILTTPTTFSNNIDIDSSSNPNPALNADVTPDIEDSSFLPSTIENSRECKNCYAVDACMLYRKVFDRDINDDEDPLAEIYEEKMGHMSEKDVEFFQKWENLLTVEEQDIDRFRSQLWTMTASERERHGRCFSGMVIESYSNDLGKSMAKIHRHSYTFVRAQRLETRTSLDSNTNKSNSQTHPEAHLSLLSGHIAKGDPVSLSIEPDLLCLSRGFVTDLTSTHVTVSVTYVIDVKALLERTKHRHHAVAPIPASGVVSGRGSEGVVAGDLIPNRPVEDGRTVVFRIDKDEMTSGIMRMRGNLAQLFLPEGDTTRRRLIVDLDKPRFNHQIVIDTISDSYLPANLNFDQRNAIKFVLAAQDYALILGMPGTGKTTTIAEIIKLLVSQGKTVLLSSYTHSAVDTILMKLLGVNFGMLRLGNVDKVHPDVQHLTLEALGPSKKLEQLSRRLMDPPVVAATCLAMDNPLFHRRKFDYCIVDEASQITLPTCLGPLRMADKFILVGDHFQLPPIVKNADARRGGLDVSLFRILSDAHPEAVTELSHQYRMNEDIMCLSNRLIYENRLKCGSEVVRKQALELGERLNCEQIYPGSTCLEACWLQDLLDENVKAVFVDTDQVPACDTQHGGLVQNEIEAQLVWQLANALNACGVAENQMAIITPYRQQIKLLNCLFKDLPKVEILTADKSQGRDKDCILISLVRSNESGYIGDLLKDWRRINVSFTRAKKKLVIFGSRRTLQGDNLLKDFFNLMNERNWIQRLPPNAHNLHQGLPPSVGMPHARASEDIEEVAGVKVNVEVEDNAVKRKVRDMGKGKVKGKAVIGERMFIGNPFVRDIVTNMS